MKPRFAVYCAAFSTIWLWALLACDSPGASGSTQAVTAPLANSPAPTAAAGSGVEATADAAEAAQARQAAQARMLRCQQQPEVCVQSPNAAGNDKGGAAH